MSAVIREFDPNADAERVASFFNVLHYGPARGGVALSGGTLEAVFRERGVELFMVAEDRGRIVGTIGYACVSGRRVAAPGELFACMFLIAPSHRASFLAGRLFAESFRRILDRDVSTLRVEVNPSNSRAYPLYVRVGFRAIEGMRPDEDGYIELVSHLPGVAKALLNAYGESESLADLLPRLDWRTLRASGGRTLSSGVQQEPDGSSSVSYDFSIGSHTVVATVAAGTGGIVSVSVDGIDDERFGRNSIREGSTPHGASLSRAVGNFVAVLSSDGALSLTHPRHLGPLFVDPAPATGGVPSGPRRPARAAVENLAQGDEWVSIATVGAQVVKRTISFEAQRISVSVESAEGASIVVAPWSGMRTAELELRTDDGAPALSAHAVRGCWPPDLTDFEAASPACWAADGTAVIWTDHASGLGFSYSFEGPGTVFEEPGTVFERPRTVRLEGCHVARLDAPGPKVSYAVVPVEAPTRDARPAAAVHRGAVPEWMESAWGGHPVLTTVGATGSRLAVSPSVGLVEWTAKGRPVLTAPFPSTRHFGPLESVSASVWAALQGDRSDLEQGAEWALHDPELPFDPVLGWSVRPSDDFSSLTVSVASEQDSPREAAVYVCAPGRPPHVDVGDSRGDLHRIPTQGAPWRTWTRSAVIPLPGGGRLVLAPETALWPEILIRSGSSGVMATLFSRHDGGRRARSSSWRLSFMEGDQR